MNSQLEPTLTTPDLEGVALLALGVLREGVVLTDAQNRIIYINSQYTAISGYSLADVYGKNPSVLSSGKQDQAFYQACWQAIQTDGYWQGEMWNRKKSGECFPEWITISAIFDADRHIRYYVAVFADISVKKVIDQVLQREASYDPLTDLANKRFFMATLTQELKQAARENYGLAVLFLDLDHFKVVNDQHGHLVGDQLLVKVAHLLQAIVRKTDSVARFGGDEFVILLTKLTAQANAQQIAHHVWQAINGAVIEMAAGVFTIDVSMGGAYYPADGLAADVLVQHADEAMYQIKKTTRHGLAFYDATLAVK